MTEEGAPAVSRETSDFGEVPAAASHVVDAERLGLMQRYAELLATDGVVRGLIGPREVPRLWDRHLLNCAVLVDLLPPGCSVADVGTGAGLPGLVLAIARPDLSVTLVEPLLRRTRFLEEAVEELGLERVTVRRARAEELHGQARFDVVTSRAVAPVDRLLGWCLPLVAPSGAMLAMKGSSVRDEVAETTSALESWGCGVPQVHVLGQDVVSVPTYALEVRWADPARSRTSPPRDRRAPTTARRRRR